MMDKINLYLDEDVHASLSLIMRKRGFNVIHAQEIDRKGKKDIEQLEYAIQNGRCIYSYNVKDFVLLHNHFVQNNKTHCGIIVSKQLTVGESLNRLLSLFQYHTKQSVINEIIFLPSTNVK